MKFVVTIILEKKTYIYMYTSKCDKRGISVNTPSSINFRMMNICRKHHASQPKFRLGQVGQEHGMNLIKPQGCAGCLMNV